MSSHCLYLSVLAASLFATLALACDSTRGGPCVPKTCEAVGAQCSALWDGCHESLDCGVCDEGVTCGSHAPNRCGEVPDDADVIEGGDVSGGDDVDGTDDVAAPADTGEGADAPTDDTGGPAEDTVAIPECTDTQLLCDGACADCPAGAGHACEGAACVATGCEAGQHHTGGACAAWVFETAFADRSDYACVAVGGGGEVGVCWRDDNYAGWGLRDSGGAWQRWTTTTSQVPVGVAVDGDGALWTVWWESFNGANYYVDRWPTRLAQPQLLGLRGEDAALATTSSGVPAVAFASGISGGNALQYLAAPSWSAATIEASPIGISTGRIGFAVAPSGEHVVAFANALTISFWRRSATGTAWTKTDVTTPEPVDTNRALRLAVDGAGVAYAAFRMQDKLALARHGASGSSVEVVSASPGAGAGAGIAVTPGGRIYLVDTDAEADLRLHVEDAGAWTIETIVAGRSRGTSAMAMGPGGVLYVAFAYQYPSGARELRLGTLDTGL